jgi:exosortase
MSVAVAREPFFARGLQRGDVLPVIATAVLFLMLYWQPLQTLVRDWLHDPDAAHGLLLTPIALVLAWRSGIAPEARAQPFVGSLLLICAILLRFMSGLAAELFTMRLSMLIAIAALVIFVLGARQILHWWLPAVLLLLAVPVPPVLLGSLALPLQLQASHIGAALLKARFVPVHLNGNIIQLPGIKLFVTEACSGLRSLTALLSLGVLLAGTMLRMPLTRVLLIAATIPIAVALNGLRIFLIGFLVYFVSPRFGDSFLHYSEGWLIFVLAFALVAGMAVALALVERRLARA